MARWRTRFDSQSTRRPLAFIAASAPFSPSGTASDEPLVAVGSSGDGRGRPVSSPLYEQCPSDARHFVGQRHRGDLIRSARQRPHGSVVRLRRAPSRRAPGATGPWSRPGSKHLPGAPRRRQPPLGRAAGRFALRAVPAAAGGRPGLGHPADGLAGPAAGRGRGRAERSTRAAGLLPDTAACAVGDAGQSHCAAGG